MTRRCKAGQRARIVGGGWNSGKVVLIIRHYFGEDMNGRWPLPLFPWVVTSLGGPLRNRDLTTNIENMPLMTIVVDDCYLQPLDDDGEDIGERAANDVHRPVALPVSNKSPAAARALSMAEKGLM